MPGDLQAIKAEALADTTAPNPEQPAAQQPQQISQAEQDEREAREWAEIPATFGAVVTMSLPELEAVYSDENCMEWGRAMVPIARKYEWKAGAGMMWLKLLGLTFAFGKETVVAVAKRRKAAAAEQPKRDGGQNVVHEQPRQAATAGEGQTIKFS